MKLSDVVVQVLDEDPRYKDMSANDKLVARSTIKETLGKQDDDVPDENVNELKTQLAFAFAAMPIFVEHHPPAA